MVETEILRRMNSQMLPTATGTNSPLGIESLSDEAILAEAVARGVDPVEQAERVKKMLLETVKRCREAKDRLMADPMPYRKDPP